MRRCVIALTVGAMLLAACGQHPGTHAVPAAAPVAAVTPTTSPNAAPTQSPVDAPAATPAPTAAAATEPAEDEIVGAEPSPASEDEDDAPPPSTEQSSQPEQEPATEDPSPKATDHGAPLWDRSFRSQRVTEDGREREWAEGTTLEVSFARHRPKGDPNPDDSLNWYAGCNWTSSGLRVKPDQLIVSGGYSTNIGCNEPYAEQDDWVRRFLHSDPQWVLDGNVLTLTSGHTTIVFREIPPEDREMPGD